MSESKTPNLEQLFQSAHDEGILSAASLHALNVNDLGAQIEAGLGISVDEVKSSEVVLVTMMVDDSGSIRFAGNTDIVREGHNEVLTALRHSSQNHRILVHTCYLNGFVLFPYLPLMLVDEAEHKRNGAINYIPNPKVLSMNRNNYNPNLGTPLFDQTVILLGRVLAKYQEFAENGVNARTVTLIITDGADEHSQKATVRKVKTLVDDLLGEHHIIAAMGIDDGGYTDFRDVFTQMGIRTEWILIPGNSSSEIRKAFQLFSQSAVRASQSAANFSQIMLGGFGIN